MTHDHVEGYHELSARQKYSPLLLFGFWDTDFYVKVDDDVHVNLGVWLFLGCKYFLLELF
jgi:beta-1,3-galactosyltransferase 1/2/3/4/5/7/8